MKISFNYFLDLEIKARSFYSKATTKQKKTEILFEKLILANVSVKNIKNKHVLSVIDAKLGNIDNYKRIYRIKSPELYHVLKRFGYKGVVTANTNHYLCSEEKDISMDKDLWSITYRLVDWAERIGYV